jgi:glycosyltransferase 2 family protein
MNARKDTPKAVPAPPQKEEEGLPPKSRRPWYIALLVAGVVLLGVSTALALLGTLDELEQKVFAVINHANLPAWVANQVAKPVSNAVWGMVFLVVALLAIPKFRRLAWQYAVAAGSTYVVVYAIEHLVARPRPADLATYEPVLRAIQGGPGFPSGHVAVLAALCLTIWPFVSWPWRIFMVVLVGVEAWSRVFLGLHAPLDIVGGVAAAMMVVAIIHLLPAKIRKIFWLSS